MPDDKPQPTIDERLEAIVMNLELLTRDTQQNTVAIRDLTALVAQDAENIRALARIADMHDRRITRLEK